MVNGRHAAAGLVILLVAASSPMARAQSTTPGTSASAGTGGDAGASTGAGAGSSASAEAAFSDSQLERLVAELGHDSVDERRAAASAISTLGQDAMPAALRKLSDLRRGGDGGVVAAMKPVRERASKEPGSDLVQNLVEMRPEPTVRRALAIACIMRALAHAGTVAAVRGMVPMAADLGGAFRLEPHEADQAAR